MHYSNAIQIGAGGDINPARFIMGDSAGDHRAVQADAPITRQVIGVSQDTTKDAPGISGSSALAAESGDQFNYYPLGAECLVETGEAITRWDLVGPDADGKAIVADFESAVGFATESIASGGKVRVQLFQRPTSGVVAVTATTDGLTTGLVPTHARTVVITSADANHIVTLPLVSKIGQEIYLVTGGTACELRTPATSGQTINGVDSDGTNEAALPASQSYIVRANGAAGWTLRAFTALGTETTAIVPDAA